MTRLDDFRPIIGPILAAVPLDEVDGVSFRADGLGLRVILHRGGFALGRTISRAETNPGGVTPEWLALGVVSDLMRQLDGARPAKVR